MWQLQTINEAGVSDSILTKTLQKGMMTRSRHEIIYNNHR